MEKPGKHDAKEPSQTLFAAINIGLLLLSIALSALMLESLENVASGAAFILFFSLSGMGALPFLFSRRNFTPGIFFAFCFLAGAACFVILFIFLKIFMLDTTAIMLIYAAAALAGFIYQALVKRERMLNWISGGAASFSSWNTTALLLCYLLAVFLLAGNVVFAGNGAYFKDPHHGTYELSISQSVDEMFHANDLSYLGKELHYNFGGAVFIHIAHSAFGMDALVSVYRFFPILSAALLISLFNFFSQGFSKGKKFALLATIFFVFGSLLILPLDVIVFRFAHSDMLQRSTGMVSFGLAIALMLGYYATIKDGEIFPLTRGQQVFLLALALIKTAIAIPIFVALGGFALLAFFKGRNAGPILSCLPVFFFGAIYALFFLGGAHPHNLWVLFPGYYDLSSPSLDGAALYIHPLVSFIFTVACAFGILAFVVLFAITESLKYVLKAGFAPRGGEAPPSVKRPLLFYAIIACGFILSVFLVEVTENTNYQLALPVFPLATALLLGHAERLAGGRKAAVMMICILAGVSAVSGIFANFVTSVPFTVPSDGSINPVVRASLSMLSIAADIKGSFSSSSCIAKRDLSKWYFYKPELIEAMEYLEKNTSHGAVVVFGRHYEFISDRCSPEAFPTDFIRTGLSGRQAIVEQQKAKGIIMQSDYGLRSMETFKFYYAVVDSESRSGKWAQLFSLLPMEIALPSYMPYFSLFAKQNYFEKRKELYSLLSTLPNELENFQGPDGGAAFATSFLDKYGISYAVFEDSEVPSAWFVKDFHAEEVFSDGSVSIYHIPLGKSG